MIDGIDYYMTTAFFKDPSEICSSSPTEKETFISQLYFQVGDDLLRAPMTASQATTNLGWYKHKCFPTMGTHFLLFNPKNAATISCDDIPPVMLLYHNNVLHGWVWVQTFNFEDMMPKGTNPQDQDWLKVNPWEPLRVEAMPITFKNPPTCLIKEGGTLVNPGVNTQHVYIRDWAQIGCGGL